MTSSPGRSGRIRSWGAVAAIAATVLGGPPAATASEQANGDSVAEAADLAEHGWTWPLAPFRLERPFEAPAHRYGPGHRGIDLRALEHRSVRAPAAGVVAFAGAVAGRGILTIDHGDGLVTTLEPIETALSAGMPLNRGDEAGTIALGGHTAPGALHFGVRLHGEYINPLLLLGGVPRAVLLPCC